MKVVLKMFVCCICSLTLVVLLSFRCCADAGPKPSIYVDFDVPENTECYVTFLTENETDFHMYVHLNDKQKITESDRKIYDDEIWDKFVEYANQNSYGFRYWYAHLNPGNNTIEWSYMPPETFKIVVYFPDTDRFIESEIVARYAFISRFSVDIDTSADAVTVHNAQAIHILEDIVYALIRMIVTIAMELGIGLLFRFRSKPQILTIIIVNIITQGILNVLLNLYVYYNGSDIFAIFGFLIGEVLVLFMEIGVYCVLFGKERKTYIISLYALVANLVSLLIGTPLAAIMTNIIKIRRS